MSVILETSLGDITVDLYTEERPKCSLNFLKLCKVKYYNWSLFHDVQSNLVAQAGDPTLTGRGGSSIYEKLYGDQARYFDAEVKPRIKHRLLGCISMVNNGSGQHGSQFFITLAPDIDYLDSKHTVFGEVAEGFEVLDKLNETYTDDNHRPYQDIRIYHTVVLDDPFPDPSGLEEHVPPSSPEITPAMVAASDRIAAEEELDDFKGKTEAEINEIKSSKEARANAQLLEMVGDLPDADITPDDNVLFVCKLNPVTTSDDLEIIFSRFGDIKSCEVIKDQKSGESLQYAFIEFEKTEDCENAFFKMDNVLIDDRRIHVDFSQSVAKKQNKYGNSGGGVDSMNRYKIRAEKPSNRSAGRNYDLVFSDDEGDGNRKNKLEKTADRRHTHQDNIRRKSPYENRKRKSPVKQDVQRESPVPRKQKRRDSPSERRRDRVSPSGMRKDRNSPRERRRDRNSPSERRRDRNSPSERRRDRNSPSERRRDRNSPSERRRDRNSPSERRKDRDSPSRRRRSPEQLKKRRESPHRRPSPDKHPKQSRNSNYEQKKRKNSPSKSKRDNSDSSSSESSSPEPQRRGKRDSPIAKRKKDRDSPYNRRDSPKHRGSHSRKESPRRRESPIRKEANRRRYDSSSSSDSQSSVERKKVKKAKKLKKQRERFESESSLSPKHNKKHKKKRHESESESSAESSPRHKKHKKKSKKHKH